MSDAITYLRLGPEHLDLLCGVNEGPFDNPVDAVQAKAYLADPGQAIVLAMADGVVVGMATGSVLLHPDKPPTMFVNEVGVRDAYLRRGIGKAVTQALFDLARRRGCDGIWLGTEPDNAGALTLYRSLKGDEVPFTGFGWNGALDEN